MRIERVQIESFGRLQGFDTGPEPMGGLVVVLGPNEAGKSTLFHFLSTAIYGFHPASRESNPYLPWGEEEAGGRITLRLDGGGRAEVERKLRSQPSGTLHIDGQSSELRNRALPSVTHVPRAVFDQVYAVTLRDLARLDVDTWATIQDRIVGSMGATDLRPARQVAAELEREAGELWRPQRRGNQRVRDVQAALRGLRERQLEARQRDGALRQMEVDLEAMRHGLHEARAERQREMTAVDRVRRLLPIRTQLVRIASLRMDAGPPEALAELPADPVGKASSLDARRTEIAARLELIERDLGDPERAVARFDERARRLLEHAEEVPTFLARAVAAGGDRPRVAALEEEVKELGRRIEGLGSDLLAGPSAAVPVGAILALPITELREAVGRFREVREAGRIAESARRPDSGSVPTHPGLLRAGLVGTVLGALVSLIGRAFPPATPVGLTLLAAGIAVLAAWALSRGAAEGPAAETGPGRAETEARERVAGLIKDIPVLQRHRDQPSDALVSGLDRLQELLRTHSERSRALTEAHARLEHIDRDAAALAASLQIESAPEAEAFAHLLDRELRHAERLREAAHAAERESRRLGRERDRLADEMDGLAGERSLLEGRLRDLGDGDAAVGLQRLQRRLAAHLRADQLTDEVERSHPDLDSVRAQIASAEAAGESWTLDAEDLNRRQVRIEELTETIESLTKRTEAAERDLAHLRLQETVDSIDGAIESLREEQARLVRERDRRWVLAQLIREADRRFRDEHQPDLVRRASAYLEHLTRGRYDRIVVDEATGGDIFQIVGPGLPAPVTLAPPISMGTLEQAYWALRLAIVDHLDEGGERLPLFLDEAFMNWDRERRRRGFAVLTSVSRSRQTFVFTCHTEIARELGAQGARLIEIGAQLEIARPS